MDTSIKETIGQDISLTLKIHLNQIWMFSIFGGEMKETIPTQLRRLEVERLTNKLKYIQMEVDYSLPIYH